MAPVGCGCELAIRAKTDPDAIARGAWANDAQDALARWRCPAAENDEGERLYPDEPADAAHLDEGCRIVLDEVERLTGYGGCVTCPFAANRRTVLPWVHEAALAWADREIGQLQTRTGPEPDAVLIDAIDEIRDASSQRTVYELEHPPAKTPPSE